MLARNPTEITVVAAALRDAKGRWLLQKRPLHKHHGGLWEFPGGKVEPGETHREALVRELNEELTIAADARGMELLASASEAPDLSGTSIVISLYTVPEWHGTPIADAGGVLGWYQISEIADLAVPPLDAVLARSLPKPG